MMSEMGFAADVIASTTGVELKVIDRSLRVRSNRTARCYLGPDAPSLRDSEGFVDTGDLVELRAGRYYFAGRRDGMINVGGSKVYPEEVEAGHQWPSTGADVACPNQKKTLSPGRSWWPT